MDAIEVDIREFREAFFEYVASGKPVVVTQGGRTVGYFFPRQPPSAADIAALREAGEAFDQTMEASEIDIEEVVAEFKALRKNARRAMIPDSKDE
jgi:antitoxin (DNA-binding transcriptional repressor) of toxin-antitoxin stability system